ncbi:MAG: YeeE/YedE family protein [Calditrichaeota bacterium]|nr:YeeE/YedE family protein [Calditrichota bacterium]
MDVLFGVWDWYIGGPLLGLFVPILLLAGNKQFGISTTFEHFCYTILPGGKNVLKTYNVSKNSWKVYFVAGIVLGAFIASTFLSEGPVQFLPPEYYSLQGALKLFMGGVLIGFGTRYANGCTAGHSIFGLSILNAGSFKATVSFFAGGVIYTGLNYLL